MQGISACACAEFLQQLRGPIRRAAMRVKDRARLADKPLAGGRVAQGA